MEQIAATVESIIYRNEDNGYTVMDIDLDGSLYTAVGMLSAAMAGERVRLTGEWKEHATYGRQFSAAAMEKLPPDTLEGILKYLSSGVIKGIGPRTAEKITGKFGLDTLDIIRYAPQRLTEVEGIGASKAVAAAEAFAREYESQEAMVFLQSLNLSLEMAMRIYKRYGAHTKETVTTNPYRLAEEIEGIGFLRADRIAMSLGGVIDSGQRAAAGLKYTLYEAGQRDGHSCLPEAELIKKATQLPGCTADQAGDALQRLTVQREVVLHTRNDIRYIYLPAYDRAERQAAERVLAISRSTGGLYGYDIDTAVQAVSIFSGVELSKGQREAVMDALSGGITVITGGPGTGKTTAIKCIISAMEQVGLKIELAAPTGRAAKRMAQASGREAKTLHRLLEYGYGGESDTPLFNRNMENPLECDALIVDEMSMVDIFLMRSLLIALKDGTRLVLVGDSDQLPSVGPGNVLRDIISSGAVKTVCLREIFRQAKESLIVMNAHRVNNGEYPDLDDKASDFFFDKKSNPDEVLRTVLEMASKRIPEYLGCDALKDIQILAPMKKGELGIENLNIELRNLFNPEAKYKPQCELAGRIFRQNDKVMQIKNNYNIKWQRPMPGGAWETGEGLYNGDIGFISRISSEERIIGITFDDDKYAEFNFEQADEIMLAYAATIHKAQGSEFDIVILPLFKGPPPLFNRNLLYTAVTRARKMVVIVGNRNCVCSMVDNNLTAARHSGLEYILRHIE